MVRAFEAQTLEVPPAEWLQTSGFRSAPSSPSIYRLNFRVKSGKIGEALMRGYGGFREGPVRIVCV
ncbi:hypothetical protein COLO4_00153 [Corchorus olitorius]|uniref:Uncharacterized protein n=1 Tax=Corchorus olitorius TaxID=93759 RepID=A0A1R3L4M5_9ROSI|nr:hypothetical protein COLO4_00153 [Corchorus olitorius]